MGVVFSTGEDFANVRMYSGSAPGCLVIFSNHVIVCILVN